MSETACFDELIARFMTAYERGEYQQALELLQSDEQRYAGHRAEIMAWQAGLLARLERNEEALQLLERADGLGYGYARRSLLEDPDYAGLHGNAEFERLVERLTARWAQSAREVDPALEFLEPTGVGPHPLCLVLHGNNSSSEATVQRWQLAAQKGWLVAAAQSSQVGWTNGAYVWNDLTRALAESRAHLAETARRYPLDAERMIVGGFSMGGQVAVRLALQADLHLRGVIAVEAWFNEEALAALEAVVSQVEGTHPGRALLLSGKENQAYYQTALRVGETLRRAGMDCRVIGTSNRGHMYPVEFADLLAEGLEWVGGPASQGG